MPIDLLSTDQLLIIHFNFLGSSDPHVNDPDRIPFAIGSQSPTKMSVFRLYTGLEYKHTIESQQP